MSRYESIVYNPSLTSLGEIKTFIRNYPRQVAHPWAIDGKRYLITVDGQEDITDVDPQFFINQAELSELEGILAAQIDKYQQLNDIKHFSFRMASPGDMISFPVNPARSNDVVFLSDKKDLYYFDGVVYFNAGGLRRIDYSGGRRSYDGVCHSGDVGSLMHSISNLSKTSSSFTLSVNGFNKRWLRKFINQQPSVLLVDYSSETIHIVPCPLDEASVGDATLVHLAYGRIVDGFYKYYIPRKPEMAEGVDTGDISSVVELSFNRAMDVLRREIDQPPAPVVAEADPVPVKTPYGKFTEIKTSLMIYIQNGIGVVDPRIPNSTVIGFGRGFTKEIIPDLPGITLPHLGIIEGSSSALCDPSQIVPGSHKRTIIHVGEMSDAAARSCQERYNGIYIVHTSLKIVGQDISVLDEVNVAAVNAMSGPISVVLVKFSDSEDLYWYRGISLLKNKIWMYGDKVDFDIEEWISSPSVLDHVVSFMSIEIDYIHPGKKYGVMIKTKDAIDLIKSHTLGEIKENLFSIIDILTQISVVSDPLKLRDYISDLLKHFKTLLNGELKSDYEKLRELKNDKEIRDKISLINATRKKYEKEISVLIDALSNLYSVRGVSKKKQYMAALIRKEAISGNVERALSMSVDDKIEWLADLNVNLAMITLGNDETGDTKPLFEMMKMVRDGQFRNMIMDGKVTIENFFLDRRMPYLDGYTFAALYEISNSDQDHPLSGSSNISIPNGPEYPRAIVPTIGIPLFPLPDPSIINWPQEANKENVAIWRILLRGLFSNASCARGIRPTNIEIGFFLLQVLFSGLYSATKKVGVGSFDPKSSMTEIIRGLFYQILTLLGSTNKTLNMGYQLFRKGIKLSIPPDNEWWIIFNLAQFLPYAGWGDEVEGIFYNNLNQLLSITIHNRLIGKAIKPMLDKAAAEKKVQKVKSERWYVYVRLVVEIIFKAARKEIELTPKVAKNLLSLSPPEEEITNGTGMMNRFVNGVIDLMRKIIKDENWSGEFLWVTRIALFSYVKHSKNIEPAEKAAIKAQIHQSRTIANLVEIYNAHTDEKPSPSWKSSDHINHEKMISDLIHNEVAGDKETFKEIVVREPTFIEKMKKIPGSSRVTVLLEQGSMGYVNFPTGFKMMTHFYQPNIWKGVIVAMLGEWRDYDSSIEAGMEVFESERKK